MQPPRLGPESWEEPVRGGSLPGEVFGLPGIAQLRSLLTGRVAPPPIAHLVGMRLTEVGIGSATFI
ncbi:MAG: hypothetical protein WCB85_11665, partial [Candidatus Dormiibacterota bacterium]